MKGKSVGIELFMAYARRKEQSNALVVIIESGTVYS